MRPNHGDILIISYNRTQVVRKRKRLMKLGINPTIPRPGRHARVPYLQEQLRILSLIDLISRLLFLLIYSGIRGQRENKRAHTPHPS